MKPVTPNSSLFRPLVLIAGVLCVSAGLLLPSSARAGDAHPDIYDRKSDAARQISDALVIAKKEHKQVLLDFGANWCGWCHKLHDLFETNAEIAAILKKHYIVVMVDVDNVDGKEHNEAADVKYGKPTDNGLPALVVLDANGKKLTIQDSGKLEDGEHHDPAKVKAFLEKWKG